EAGSTNTMKIAAIAAFTQSGNTVLYMSRHLSRVPIYALTPLESTAGRVTLYRNVIPKPIRGDYGPRDAQEATRDAFSVMLYDKLVTEDDLVVMTLGTPMGEAGSTNTLKIVHASEVFKAAN
ncbi:MAG: pyruvate kinase alpha/beta domain-containing protein, partial [Mariprofundaceae bacterium]|nr:pyruvate kinase alpha/beta domain-containing protein [Mariprofundaceae bacterium]